MTIEKIILGDDNLDFARKAMPYVPDAQVDFVDNPISLIEAVRKGGYTTLISDLDYGAGKIDGIEVFKQIAKENLSLDSRKILWTGSANEPKVIESAKELGLILLDKDELGTIVGLSVSKAPLKSDGKVLIYMPGDSVTYRALEQVTKIFFAPEKVDISNKLRESLSTNQYGLVIDCSLMMHFRDKEKHYNGSVAHDLKYLKLESVPRVVCVNNVCTAVVDILNAVAGFYDSKIKP